MKLPSVIYVNTESLFEKTHKCNNKPEKPPITEINKHAPCGYSIFLHCSFDSNKNNHDFYKGEDPMKSFCADLKKHAREIINSGKKEMLPLTEEENDSYKNQSFCHMC